MLHEFLLSCVRIPCLAILVCSAACAPASPPGLPSASRDEFGRGPVLTDAELISLFTDANVVPYPAPKVSVSHSLHEVFRANGAYQRIIGRTALEGIFDVGGGMVCVEGADFSRQCRTVQTNNDGTYTLTNTQDKSVTTVSITSLK